MKKTSVSETEENKPPHSTLSNIYDNLNLIKSELFNREFLMWFKKRIFPDDDNGDDEDREKMAR